MPNQNVNLHGPLVDGPGGSGSPNRLGSIDHARPDMQPRDGYGPGPCVGHEIPARGRLAGKVTGVVVGQAGPWIDVRWSDGEMSFSDSRLFSELAAHREGEG